MSIQRDSEQIPEGNNVYGILLCKGSLEKVAQVLREHFSLGADCIAVKNPTFYERQELRVDAWPGDFLVYGAEGDEYLFNGAVAGSNEEICLYVKGIQSALSEAGYRITLEVYDEEQNCIAVFPK